MRVRLTLDGHKADVLACVGIALETGILDNMETVSKLETDDLPELSGRESQQEKWRRQKREQREREGRTPRKRGTQADALRPFPVGTRVMLKWQVAGYKFAAGKGDTGSVVKAEGYKGGALIHVKWDVSGETDKVPASQLKVIRKIPLADRR